MSNSLVTSISTPPAASPNYPVDQNSTQLSANLNSIFTAAELGFLEEMLIYIEQETPVGRYTDQQLALLESCKQKLEATHPQ